MGQLLSNSPMQSIAIFWSLPPSAQEGWCLVLVKEKVCVIAWVQLDLRSSQTAPINQPRAIDLTSKALIEK